MERGVMIKKIRDKNVSLWTKKTTGFRH